MPRSPFQHLLRVVGTLFVVAVLGFVVLPAIVVFFAAFNDRAHSVVSAAGMVVAVVRQGAHL